MTILLSVISWCDYFVIGHQLVRLSCYRSSAGVTILLSVISWCELPVTRFPVGVTILLKGGIVIGLQFRLLQRYLCDFRVTGLPAGLNIELQRYLLA